MQPTLIDQLANNDHEVRSISLGNYHVVASTTDKQTIAYGQGKYGELGFGPEGGSSSSQPKFVDSLNGVQVLDVQAGWGTTLFVLEDSAAAKDLPVWEEEEEQGEKSKKKKKS